MHKVRDGQRTLQFEGREIGFASSERPNSTRWIEFTLYITDEAKQYVLSRVGCSKLYHLPNCETALNSRLVEEYRTEISEEDLPCTECNPHLSDFPLVCLERDRCWARVYSTANDVLQGLMKVDSRSGNKYLTAVARRLLEDAGSVDDGIYEATSIETIR